MIEKEFGESSKSIMLSASGDPVYSKLYREYLINFDVTKYPNLDFIHLITNGVLLDAKMWNSFKAKPYIKTLDISIDAGNKETYENIVRLNGDWDKLMDNIKFLCKQDEIDTLMFSMVVCKYNYKEMLQMYEVIMDILKDITDKTIKFVYTQLLPNSHGAYTFAEYNNITIFNENNSEFDEEEILTQEISVEDVVRVAMDLGMNPSIAEINEVLKYYDNEVEEDPTATWDLIVENLLYNCVAPK